MDDAVEIFAVAAVVDIVIRVDAAQADGEAVEAVVGFGPPAVELERGGNFAFWFDLPASDLQRSFRFAE